jgi:hypothetical protein
MGYHVHGGADGCPRTAITHPRGVVFQHFGDAKVAQFHNPTLQQEKICGFDVSVNHAFAVQILKGLVRLHQPE